MTPSARLVRGTTVVAVVAAYFTYAFQLHRGTFLSAGLGTWVDPYLVNYLLEHWYYSFRHLTDPSSPLMFFPATGTLGYSHGLVLYAPVYIAARTIFGPFTAETVALWLVMVAGSTACYVILRRFIGAGFVESLLVTLFFCSSQNVINDMMTEWAQRGSVFLIPPIALMVLDASAAKPGARRNLMAGGGGLCALLLFTQDFHTGIFAALFVVLFGIAWPDVVLSRMAGALSAWREAWRDMRRQHPARTRPAWIARPPHRAWLIVTGAAGLLALLIWIHPFGEVEIGPLKLSAENYRRPLALALLGGGWLVLRWLAPRRLLTRLVRTIGSFPAMTSFLIGATAGALVFLWIYLPVYLRHQSFAEAILFESLKTIDPSSWRSISTAVADLQAYRSVRSFILVGLVAVLAVSAPARVGKRGLRLALWSLGVTALVMILPLAIGTFSYWQTLIGWIPGFTALRDPKRIIYLYELAVAAAMAVFLVGLPKRAPIRTAVTAALAVLLVLFWNREVLEYGRPTETFRKFVEAPIAIDPACRSFSVKVASPEYMSRTFHQAMLYGGDAMFIALHNSIPTLNGYSAWLPDNWNMGNPQEVAAYEEARGRWIALNHLTNVCVLDIEARTMKPGPRFD